MLSQVIRKEYIIEKYFLIFQPKYVAVTQKNHLNGSLEHPNQMFKQLDMRKKLQFYVENFCLCGPM